MTAGPRRQGKVGIRDVAAATGLSTTTVSHALSGKRRVSEEVRLRVVAAADALGYSANPIARAMRTGQTGVIGFISENAVTRPHGGRMLLGAQDAAAADGKILMIINVDRVDDAAAHKQIAALIAHEVDGLILASNHHRVLAVPHLLRRQQRVVLLDCTDPGFPTPSVVPDEQQIGIDATRTLHRHRHRDIVHLTINQAGPAVDGRRVGYQLAAQEQDQAAPFIAVDGPANARAGRLATMRALRTHPRTTALFCFNDQMAMGAYQAAAALRVAVPEELSIIGVDDLPLIAAEIQPPLTTVALPHYEMGAAAVHLLNAERPRQQLDQHAGTVRPRASVTAPRTRPFSARPRSAG